ncbi:immunity 22 family protein [Trinickia sp.]|uniref:immunity 22 family protein n=1 Tax=Trinickia sp. TaxID=2571163 RepID=UPI003F7EC2B7
MYNELKVSAWVGQFSDAHDLIRYVETRFDASENSMSQFWRDTGISWHDDDFREASMILPGNDTLADELRTFSYGESFAEALLRRLIDVRRAGMNGLILLYDFDYRNADARRPHSRVEFVGSFDYRK